jgi:hypothetical protein
VEEEKEEVEEEEKEKDHLEKINNSALCQAYKSSSVLVNNRLIIRKVIQKEARCLS